MNYTHAADKVRIVVLVGIGSFRTLDQQFVECLLLFFFPVIVCWKLWLIVCQLPQIFPRDRMDSIRPSKKPTFWADKADASPICCMV
jgi:hypothetical protein